MPRKTRSKKGKKRTMRKPYKMVGCSKQRVHVCTKCGPNCHCGPNCNCPHPCPGNCYLNRRSKTRRRKQRGGQGCGSCGCPIAPLSSKQMNMFGGGFKPIPIPTSGSYDGYTNQNNANSYGSIIGIGQNGGTCSACQMKGGGFYKPIGPMPGPLVGKPWASDLKWPAMNDVGGDRNYLASYSNVISNDPTRQQMPADADAGYLDKMSLVGGYRYDKYDKKPRSAVSFIKKGGGLVPQDLVNLGRDLGYNFKTAYNALNGYKAPVDPSPYKGQLTGALNNNRFLM